jgi:hypothetical protein
VNINYLPGEGLSLLPQSGIRFMGFSQIRLPDSIPGAFPVQFYAPDYS